MHHHPNKNKEIEIVIARYNEDLKWTAELPFNNYQYTVYNKGIDENFEKCNVDKIINLPNVGRCDHTYLYHIVHNFNKLAPITIFIPGSVSMESKQDKFLKLIDDITYYNQSVFRAIPITNIQKDLGDFTLDVWAASNEQNCKLNNESILYPAKIRPFGKWYSYFFGNQLCKYVSYWGIFSMDRRDIIKHNIHKYIKLLGAIGCHSNPEVGHYIERSWEAIFHPLLYTKIVDETNDHRHRKRPTITVLKPYRTNRIKK